MKHTLRTKSDIIEEITAQKKKLLSFGVKRLGLFGSYSRGNQSIKSDVDILVEFKPHLKTFDNFIQLSFFLEELLQCRVDLITREALSPYIGPYIMEEVEYVDFTA